jgi:hypothetical protein
VRRDVGRAALTVAAVLLLLLAGLRGVLRLLQAEVVHVELIGHDCDVFVDRECALVGMCVCMCGVLRHVRRLVQGTLAKRHRRLFMRVGEDVVFQRLLEHWEEGVRRRYFLDEK